MENAKRITIAFIVIFLTVSPLINCCSYSYAEDNNNDDIWQPVDTKETFTAALKAYYRARGKEVKIMNSLNEAMYSKMYVSFVYNAQQIAAKALGINLSALQTHLKYRIETNGALKFLYDDTALDVLNQMYAYLLQYYGIGENEEKTVYSGEWIEDDDGNGCYVFYVDTQSALQSNMESHIQKYGTAYLILFPPITFATMQNGGVTPYTKTFNNHDYTVTFYIKRALYNNYPLYSDVLQFSNNGSPTNTTSSFGALFYWENQSAASYGYPAIFKYNNNYYLGNFFKGDISYEDNFGDLHLQDMSAFQAYMGINVADSATNAAVKIAQGGAQNAGLAAATQAAIDVGQYGANAIKDYLEDDDPEEPQVTEDPDSGGNGGNGGGDTNIGPFNVFGFIDFDGNVHFHMPHTNQFAPDGFTITGLLQKFPFCIPLDIYAVLDLMDASPVTPRFQTTINFPTFDYQLDINLTQFDSTMAYFRKLILILYIMGILILTPYIVK